MDGGRRKMPDGLCFSIGRNVGKLMLNRFGGHRVSQCSLYQSYELESIFTLISVPLRDVEQVSIYSVP